MRQLYDLGRIGDAYFIATEYVDGINLEGILAEHRRRGAPAPMSVVCAIVAQVCDALAYTHGKKDTTGEPMPVIHGALHPRNVLVSFAGDVKMTDFGGTS